MSESPNDGSPLLRKTILTEQLEACLPGSRRTRHSESSPTELTGSRRTRHSESSPTELTGSRRTRHSESCTEELKKGGLAKSPPLKKSKVSEPAEINAAIFRKTRLSESLHAGSIAAGSPTPKKMKRAELMNRKKDRVITRCSIHKF